MVVEAQSALQGKLLGRKDAVVLGVGSPWGWACGCPLQSPRDQRGRCGLPAVQLT
jgi:hypothetical protein